MANPKLIKIEHIDNFNEISNFPPSVISKEVIARVKSLDEREELEPYIRSIIFDVNATPHGPAEIVDILTQKITMKRLEGLAAIILKGKSFPVVRPKDIAHQIYRLEKIDGLNYAILGATGIILDGVKEQFLSTVIRLGCNYAILDACDLARILVAYGFICPRDGRKIAAGRCKCGYSPKKRILNVLQTDSLKALDEAHQLKQTAGLIVLPPGSGKTRIAAEDFRRVVGKVALYIAHTHEILDVAQSEFEGILGKNNVLRIDSIDKLQSTRKVNIATIQFIQRNIERIHKAQFDYLVIDEFHHAAAKSYRKLLMHVNPSFLLGLTATPFRADRRNILQLCDNNILVNFELRTGIETGILCPYHYFGCFDDIDYSRIRHNGIRYDIRDLEKALIIPDRDNAVIDKWREMADGKPTLAFCCSHKHAYRLAESFNNAGIAAEPYLSSTSIDKRIELTKKLQDGDIQILCVVDVLNEGADLPFIETLLFLRPTESKRIFYQQLGRGLRKYTGKSHVVVVDFIGNFKNAYKIVEYQGLMPAIEEETSIDCGRIRNTKEVFNLPLGCRVHFDDRVIDVFIQQSLDPRHATRHNIGRILIYQYQKLRKRLNHQPSKAEVDRNLLLNSDFYETVFGGWKNFESIVENS